MLVPTLLLAGLVSAVPALVSRQDNATGLDPWQITAASADRPSGRPGSGTTSNIRVTIKDPNDIILRAGPTGHIAFTHFEAACSWAWDSSVLGNFPAGVETVCVDTATKPSASGNFTMTLSGTSQANFSVAIKETREVVPYGYRFLRVYEGERAIQVGDGVPGGWRTLCGGSGHCSWQFADGLLPIDVQQELTESVGTCEEINDC